MPRHALTVKEIENAKPRLKPYRLFDGDGLALLVAPTGTKSWQFRYRLNGKGQTASLGRYPDITLSSARGKAIDARTAAANGAHLTVEKKVTKARRIAADAETFAEWREHWVTYRRPLWCASYIKEVEARFTNHLALLDPLPVSRITAAEVAPLIERAERKAPEVARKCEQQVRAVMDYCVRRGKLIQNPLPRPERGAKALPTRHRAAVLDRVEVGAILRSAAATEG